MLAQRLTGKMTPDMRTGAAVVNDGKLDDVERREGRPANAGFRRGHAEPSGRARDDFGDARISVVFCTSRL
jgi:hypothetical protein